MTCKDCIHFEVCDSGRHIGEYIEDDGVYSDGVEKECPTFLSARYAFSEEWGDALDVFTECLLESIKKIEDPIGKWIASVYITGIINSVREALKKRQKEDKNERPN